MQSSSAERILFIGAGNMGGAILTAITDSGYPAKSVFFYEPSDGQASKIAEKSKAARITSLSDGFSKADVVFLCLKPQIFMKDTGVFYRELQNSNKNLIVVSIMAGVKISDLRAAFHENAVIVRTMPNIAVTVKKGTVAIATDEVGEKALQTVELLFSMCSRTVRVSESQMDAVTGLSGSGPAYVFQFIEALAMGGVKMGLQRDIAMQLALSTVSGSIKMLSESKLGTSELTASVCSPAGTTIAGLQKLEEMAFKGTIIDAIEAATNRSVELGK